MQKIGGDSAAASLPERTNAAAGEYAAAVKQLGKELGLPVVDLWTDIQKQPLWEAYLSDGLHFTSFGNTAVYHLVQAKFNEALPHLRCHTLKVFFLCAITFPFQGALTVCKHGLLSMEEAGSWLYNALMPKGE